MNEVVKNALKEKPILIPKVLFNNYQKLNITPEELIVLIYLLNEGDKVPYNPSMFATDLNQDKYKTMQLLNDLTEKKIIEVKLETNQYNKKEEYIYLDLLYNKLFNLLLETTHETIITIDNNIFSLFERELGRTISPMEVEIIKEWIQAGISEELIKEALKEAIYNNVRNLKYVDRILFTWQQKGIKTKNDIIKDKKNYRKSQKTPEPIYDYNWLEDE